MPGSGSHFRYLVLNTVFSTRTSANKHYIVIANFSLLCTLGIQYAKGLSPDLKHLSQ